MPFGVIAYRAPTGEFIDDEPIFDDFEIDQEYSPLDDFISYITERICKEL